VTLPQAGNIGGGGFLVAVAAPGHGTARSAPAWRGRRGWDGGRAVTINFREKAPLAARAILFPCCRWNPVDRLKATRSLPEHGACLATVAGLVLASAATDACRSPP